jgi:hypothetical protein
VSTLLFIVNVFFCFALTPFVSEFLASSFKSHAANPTAALKSQLPRDVDPIVQVFISLHRAAISYIPLHGSLLRLAAFSVLTLRSRACIAPRILLSFARVPRCLRQEVLLQAATAPA